MTDVHELSVQAGTLDVEQPDVDELDYDYEEGLNGGEEKSCCPSYVPWLLFGLFAILALVFIILYALAKSDAKDKERTAPGLINQNIEQPKHVSFKYMTPAALAAGGIDFNLEAKDKQDAKAVGTAVFNNKDVTLNVGSGGAALKDLLSDGHKAAYWRSALHSFALQAKEIKKDDAKDLTIAITYENKDTLKVIYEFLEEATIKKMITKVIIYKKISVDVPTAKNQLQGNQTDHYPIFAKAIKKNGDQDNFDDLVSNKDLAQKVKNVYACYVDLPTLDAYYQAADKAQTGETADDRTKAKTEMDEKKKAIDEDKKSEKDNFTEKLDAAKKALNDEADALKKGYEKAAPAPAK